jgi:hypothetical protein
VNSIYLDAFTDMGACHVWLQKPTMKNLNGAHPLEYRYTNFTCNANARTRSINVPTTQLSRVSSYPSATATDNRLPRFVTRAGSSDIDISSLLDDLDLPEIDADLASFQAEAGAVFDVSFY